MAIERIPSLPSATLAPLGWDAGWTVAFEPYAADGHRPARVVAVHRETSVVRDGTGEDRQANVSGSFRYAALGPAEFPTVGDWVAVDASGVIAAVLPRRTSFSRMATDASRRGARADDEQVMA